MPAPRARALLDLAIPAAAGAVAGGAAFAVAAPAVGAWPLIAGGGATVLGTVGAAWFAGRRTGREHASTAGDAGRDDEAPAARRRSRPTVPAGDDAIVALLRDVRDAYAARDAVFWRVVADGEGLVPEAAAGGAAWDESLDATTLGVIAWSAQERVAQYVAGDGGRGSLAVAPVTARGELVGSISVHDAAPIAATPEEIKTRLARHALRLGDLVDLVDTRAAHERQSQQRQQLLVAARDLPGIRSPQELAAALCAAVLELTAADRAALVRWHPDTARGVVDHLTAGWAGNVPRGVARESLVGETCAEAMPRLWEDARRLGVESPVFAAGERLRPRQALAIVPITGRRGVLGAVVVESEHPGRLRAAELPAVRLLTAIASASIEALDEFEAAEREAYTDALTGLPNRRAFDAQFAPAIDRADRFDEPVALVVCDVDEFKAVNDRHGHPVGDSVLQAIGATLQRGVRAVDLCARFGGEEFVMILPRTARLGAVELAERLRRAIEARPIRVDGRELRVTASFGVAIYPASVTSRDDLLAAADRALYAAKRDGRNCVRCADATAVFD